MISYVTPNYSDIFPGQRPTMQELLKDTPSEAIIVLLAMINSELYTGEDDMETQVRITEFIAKRFPLIEKVKFLNGFRNFIAKIKNEPCLIWGKRYILEFLKNEFLNYKDLSSFDTTPEQEVNILKAYLLQAELINERDRIELANSRKGIEENDPYFFEKMVWPSTLNQFDTNNQVEPIYNLAKLLCLVKYLINNETLRNYLIEFQEINGFASIKTFLGSFVELIKIALYRMQMQLLKNLFL